MEHFFELVAELLFGLAKHSPDKMPDDITYKPNFIVKHPIKKILGFHPVLFRTRMTNENPLSKEGGFCLYYSLFIIHHSLFIYLKRILNE